MALAVVFTFLAAFGFSCSYIFIRIGTQQISPLTATFFSVSTGAVLVTGLALLFNWGDVTSLEPNDFIWFTVMGALGYPGALVFINTATSWVGASRAAPWASLQPLFALALGMTFLRERPNLLVGLGTPMIVCGLVLVVLAGGINNPRVNMGTVRRLGYLVAVGGAFCHASRDVISRHVVGNITDPMVTAGMALCIGCVMLFMITAPDAVNSVRRVPGRYLAMCGLAGIGQGLGVASLFQALSLAPVTVVSPINASGPLITLLLVHLFLQRVESITPRLVFGTFLSVAGVITVILGAVAY